MHASLSSLRTTLGAAACLAVMLRAPTAAAADPPPAPPPQGAAPSPPAQQAPPPSAPAPYGYPAGAVPPGLTWMSPPPGLAPSGYAQPYPGYYPMPYQPAMPRLDFQLPAPPPRRYKSVAMFASGLVMVAGGVAGVIAGAVLVSSAANRIDLYCDSPSFPCGHEDDASRRSGGAALMAIGAVVGGAGIPLWIVGSKMMLIPKDERRPALVPELRVGAASATVALSF